GNIHSHQGNYEEAVKLYNQSLKIKEELGDKGLIATTLAQLGTIHEEKEEHELALQFYFTAFKVFDILGSPYRELVQKNIERLEGKMREKEEKKKKKWWKIF
ncbi:tetratricopeptide repeat protein, partial [Methanosarcina mazei]